MPCNNNWKERLFNGGGEKDPNLLLISAKLTGSRVGVILAYDIVKTHGGEMNVETKEGEGSEFIIELPK